MLNKRWYKVSATVMIVCKDGEYYLLQLNDSEYEYTEHAESTSFNEESLWDLGQNLYFIKSKNKISFRNEEQWLNDSIPESNIESIKFDIIRTPVLSNQIKMDSVTVMDFSDYLVDRIMLRGL